MSMPVRRLSMSRPSAKDPHKAAQRTTQSRAAAVLLAATPRALSNAEALTCLT